MQWPRRGRDADVRPPFCQAKARPRGTPRAPPFRSRTTIDRPCNPPSLAPDVLQGVGHARAARPRQR